jgi:molecular chaperone Hsp33
VADACIKAVIRAAQLEITVADTTDLCRNAQAAHSLAATSIIALGRLLTAASLVALTAKRRGTTSLQVLTRSRLRQIFADVTHDGHGRGFVKRTDLAFPVMSGEQANGRRNIALAVLPGKLSVVRSSGDGRYTQSTTDLVSGEVDADVDHFLEQSDQIPTALACDILMTEDLVETAGGALIQGLPGGDGERLARLRSTLREEGFADKLRLHAGDPVALLRAIAPDATVIEAPAAIQWKCKCSKPRVLAALKMLSPQDLAELVAKGDDVRVGCDLCGASYEVSASDIEQVFLSGIKSQG